jgi:hypothetical protein
MRRWWVGSVAMSDQEYTAGLKPHIAALRERAAQARRLANEVDDTLAREGLIQHAEEFECRAQELEAQLAVLKEEAQSADASHDIAALKPPGDTPEGEGAG